MSKRYRIGVIYAVSAYTLWGILPLYWKLIDNVSSIEILAHRILWAFAFCGALLTWNQQWEEFREVISNKNSILFSALAAITITINWGLYIWAVNSGHVVEASMGYYINPLIVVIIGMLFFKEKLNYWQAAALGMALIGVGILTFQYGKIPWISIVLAFTFALYGAMKKMVKVSSMIGLTLETAIITPIAIILIGSKQLNGTGALGSITLGCILLLIGAGAVTAIPMLLFAKGVKRIPLSTLGFAQYISPTISLLLGIYVFHETFTNTHLFSFGFIWFGLLIYSISQTNLVKRNMSYDKVYSAGYTDVIKD